MAKPISINIETPTGFFCANVEPQGNNTWRVKMGRYVSTPLSKDKAMLLAVQWVEDAARKG